MSLQLLLATSVFDIKARRLSDLMGRSQFNLGTKGVPSDSTLVSHHNHDDGLLD